MALRFIVAAVAATLPTAALPAAAAPPRVSAVEQASIQQALSRGALIYAYDKAAWVGTDDMLTRIKNPEKVVGGWIVDGPAEAPELVFFDQNPTEPRAVYVARFQGRRLVSSRVVGPGEDSSLSAERKRLVTAQRAAVKAFMSSRPARCSDQQFNTLILPPPAPGAPALVYFLTPQTERDAIPFGGHYLVQVSADGKAAPARPFSKSCLNMPFRKPGVPSPEALAVTHLLDPVPTEIHVFSSLAAGLPLVVMTTQNNKVWSVTGSRIEGIGMKGLK
ncbi:MAG TPA: hypothetical protein VGR19_03905 [Allosphingosinicella sp.]|nr:hypothetical protein [Allosphingosinicella sp.]